MPDDTRNARVELLIENIRLAKLVDIQRRLLVAVIRMCPDRTLRVTEALYESIGPMAYPRAHVDRAARQMVVVEEEKKS